MAKQAKQKRPDPVAEELCIMNRFTVQGRALAELLDALEQPEALAAWQKADAEVSQ